MTLCSELAESEWLTGDEARVLLAELAGESAELHTVVAHLRDRFTASQTHLLLEQVELRRRATAKFTHAARMYFTRLGLEQATDEWIARHKATRFAQLAAERAAGFTPAVIPAPPPVLADLCCGIGGDLMALAEVGSAVGIDQNPITAHFAAINSGAPVHAIDVAGFDFNGIDAWHIDPDRRPTGRRTTSLDWCTPNLETIEQLLARCPNAAVKLAPGAKPPDEWTSRCEFEWISRDRECRQLVAWHGNLARTPGQHRATILPTPSTNSAACGLAPRTLHGPPNQTTPITSQPDTFVFDTDPAISAARLTGVLAAEHNLRALAVGPTYLTGSQPIIDPALGCFQVDEVLPLRIRTLAQLLKARGIGQLEIKKRGVDTDPEKLRRELKLQGPNAATLLITPIAGRPTAILAHRPHP